MRKGDIVATVTFPGIATGGDVGAFYIRGTDNLTDTDFIQEGEDENVNFPERVASHEFGHAIGLAHAAARTLSSEFDPYAHSPWEYGSPGAVMAICCDLTVHEHDRLGLLAQDRIFQFGNDGRSEATIALTDHQDRTPANGVYHAIRIPYWPAETDRYLLIEYATRSRSIGSSSTDRTAPRIYIHDVRRYSHYRDDWALYPTSREKDPAWRAATLVSGNKPVRSPWRKPLDRLNAGGILIEPVGYNLDRSVVQMRVKAPIALACALPHRPRRLNASDDVCVTPERHKAIASEESEKIQAERRNGNRCKRGFVPRNAVSGDSVCVTGQSKQATDLENLVHRGAGNYKLTNLARGPHTCPRGQVWRSNDPYDYVCVSSLQAPADLITFDPNDPSGRYWDFPLDLYDPCRIRFGEHVRPQAPFECGAPTGPFDGTRRMELR